MTSRSITCPKGGWTNLLSSDVIEGEAAGSGGTFDFFNLPLLARGELDHSHERLRRASSLAGE